MPPFWRPEVFHPLVVHFPLALLPVASLCRIVHYLFRNQAKFHFLLPASRLLLVIGLIFAGGAIWSGNIAENFVNRKICDPTVTQNHEKFTLFSTYSFTVAILFDFLLWKYKRIPIQLARVFTIALILSLTTGTLLLARGGHLGATLVYQQGAGVYQPSSNCKEFESIESF